MRREVQLRVGEGMKRGEVNLSPVESALRRIGRERLQAEEGDTRAQDRS